MGEEQKFFETTDGYVLHGRDDEVGNIYGRGLPLRVYMLLAEPLKANSTDQLTFLS